MRIILYPNKILSQVAKPVVPDEKDTTRSIIKNMIVTMRRNRGTGLAAPQIGINRRVIVWDFESKEQAAINPVIIYSRGKVTTREGCLSLPNIKRDIKRKRVIVIEALDKNGKLFKREFRNMDAVIIQHEIDHLNGITILDGAKRRRFYND